MASRPATEKAQEEGLFEPEETVVSCAFGKQRGDIFKGVDNAVGTGGLLGAVFQLGKSAYETQIKTEVCLTDRRLLIVDRQPFTGKLKELEEVPLEEMIEARPIVRRNGHALCLGELEVKTDANQPFDMAGEFVERYKWLIDQLSQGEEEQQTPRGAVEQGKTAAERLKEVHALYQAGTLSEQEYAAKKSELMKFL